MLDKPREGRGTQPSLEEGERKAFKKSKFKENNKDVGVESKAVFLAEGTKSERLLSESEVCQELEEVVSSHKTDGKCRGNLLKK